MTHGQRSALPPGVQRRVVFGRAVPREAVHVHAHVHAHVEKRSSSKNESDGVGEELIKAPATRVRALLTDNILTYWVVLVKTRTPLIDLTRCRAACWQVRDVRRLPEHHMRLDTARAILRGRPPMDAGGAGRHLPLPLGEQWPPAGDRVQSAPPSKTSPMPASAAQLQGRFWPEPGAA